MSEQLSLAGVGPIAPAKPKNWAPTPLEDPPPGVVLGFDTETTGLKWWRGDRPVGISVAYREPGSGKLVSRYYPFGHRGGGNLDPDRVFDWARSALRNRRLAGLNLGFDVHQSREWGLDLELLGARVSDVGHRAALLDDERRRGFSLEAIAQDYLGRGKVEGIVGARIADLPAWTVEDYAKTDAELALEVFEIQEPRLAEEELLDVAALEEEVFWPTLAMERVGALIDVDKLATWEREVRALVVRKQTDLYRAVGFAVNPDSPADLARLFRNEGIEIEKWTLGSADGRIPPRPSFTAEVLAAAAERSEAVGLALEIARLNDLLSKYLSAYLSTVGSDGILRFQLHQLRGDSYGTVSGRFSSSKACGEGANIQQVLAVEKQKRLYGEKYLVRDLFIPAREKLLLAADAKQIEYRVFAHYAGSERIYAAYRANPEVDFHELSGAAVRRYRPDFDRKRVKNCNFAVLFGSGIGKLGEMLGVSEAEARETMDAYDHALPEARKLMRTAMRRAETAGFVRTLRGRRARFAEGKRLHSALNRVIQGSAADLMKEKLVALYARRREFGLTLRMTVHDEVVGDVPDIEAGRAVDRALNEQPEGVKVPILWSTETGATWATTSPVF